LLPSLPQLLLKNRKSREEDIRTTLRIETQEDPEKIIKFNTERETKMKMKVLSVSRGVSEHYK